MTVDKEDHCLHLAWSLQSKLLVSCCPGQYTEITACYGKFKTAMTTVLPANDRTRCAVPANSERSSMSHEARAAVPSARF